MAVGRWIMKYAQFVEDNYFFSIAAFFDEKTMHACQYWARAQGDWAQILLLGETIAGCMSMEDAICGSDSTRPLLGQFASLLKYLNASIAQLSPLLHRQRDLAQPSCGGRRRSCCRFVRQPLHDRQWQQRTERTLIDFITFVLTIQQLVHVVISHISKNGVDVGSRRLLELTPKPMLMLARPFDACFFQSMSLFCVFYMSTRAREKQAGQDEDCLRQAAGVRNLTRRLR